MKKLILLLFFILLSINLFAEGEKYHLNLGEYNTIKYEDLTDIYGYRIQLEGKYDYKPKEYIATSKKILTLEEYNEMLNHLIEKIRIGTPKNKPVYYTEFAQKIKTKYPEYKDMEDLELTKLMVREHPIYKDKVVYPMTKKTEGTNISKFDITTAKPISQTQISQENTTQEDFKSFSEKLEKFFNPEENYFIALIYILLIITFCFVYPIQIIIVLIGLFFHLFKQKQTVKYLLIPYGFIFILMNYYKELQ